MMTLYVICLMVGLIFAVLSFVLSGGFEAQVDGDVGVGTDVHVDGDISGGDTGIGDVHFPLFSPVVIASFVAFFGAGGIVGLKIFVLFPLASVLVGLAFGVGMGLLVGYTLMKIYKHLQTNATTSAASLLGHLAEVTEPIPAEGVGQIAFSGKGQRIAGPARSQEKKEIKRHALVTITRVVGGLYWVREHVEERLRDVDTSAEGESDPVAGGGEKKAD